MYKPDNQTDYIGYTPDYQKIQKLLDSHIRLIEEYKKEVSMKNPVFANVLGMMNFQILPSIEKIYSELHKNYKFSKITLNGKLNIIDVSTEVSE